MISVCIYNDNIIWDFLGCERKRIGWSLTVIVVDEFSGTNHDFEYYLFIRIRSSIASSSTAESRNLKRTYTQEPRECLQQARHISLWSKHVAGHCCKTGFYLPLDNAPRFLFPVKQTAGLILCASNAAIFYRRQVSSA